jgi:uncharacterized membrane protein YsdA (DUF1294 family)
MPDRRCVLLVYLGLIGLIAVVVTCADKRAAVRHRRRVPESTLLLLAALGGSLPMLVTMRCIRHKTRKPKFMVGIPLILLAQLLLAGCILFWKKGWI